VVEVVASYQKKCNFANLDKVEIKQVHRKSIISYIELLVVVQFNTDKKVNCFNKKTGGSVLNKEQQSLQIVPAVQLFKVAAWLSVQSIF